MSHRLPLAVFALPAIVGGCSAGTSLVDRPLQGSVIVDDFDTLENVVVFTFDDETGSFAGAEGEGCPYLNTGAVTFDGEVIDEDFGGRSQRLLFNPGCVPPVVAADIGTGGEQRDATLEITSGPEQDVVRYTGRGLVAVRRLVPLDGLDVVAGESLRLGYGAPSDTLRNLQAFLTIDEDVRFFVSASGTEDVLTVSFPQDTPAGTHTMAVSFGFDVDTEQCDGFASCEVKGAVAQEFNVTVTR